MDIATSLNFGSALCEVFGINPKLASEISIHVKPDSVLEVQAKMVASEEQIRETIEMAKRYQMVPLENVEQ